MDYSAILAIGLCAIFYYRLGEAEYERGVLLAAASVALGALTMLVLGWGLLATFFAQAGIYAVLTLWKLRRR
jgi:hypothetical protein